VSSKRISFPSGSLGELPPRFATARTGVRCGSTPHGFCGEQRSAAFERIDRQLRAGLDPRQDEPQRILGKWKHDRDRIELRDDADAGGAARRHDVSDVDEPQSHSRRAGAPGGIGAASAQREGLLRPCLIHSRACLADGARMRLPASARTTRNGVTLISGSRQPKDCCARPTISSSAPGNPSGPAGR
jgi:hypothetical protein